MNYEAVADRGRRLKYGPRPAQWIGVESAFGALENWNRGGCSMTRFHLVLFLFGATCWAGCGGAGGNFLGEDAEAESLAFGEHLGQIQYDPSVPSPVTLPVSRPFAISAFQFAGCNDEFTAVGVSVEGGRATPAGTANTFEINNGRGAHISGITASFASNLREGCTIEVLGSRVN
jgi:hypothetical protein